MYAIGRLLSTLSPVFLKKKLPAAERSVLRGRILSNMTWFKKRPFWGQNSPASGSKFSSQKMPNKPLTTSVTIWCLLGEGDLCTIDFFWFSSFFGFAFSCIKAARLLKPLILQCFPCFLVFDFATPWNAQIDNLPFSGFSIFWVHNRAKNSQTQGANIVCVF